MLRIVLVHLFSAGAFVCFLCMSMSMFMSTSTYMCAFRVVCGMGVWDKARNQPSNFLKFVCLHKILFPKVRLSKFVSFNFKKSYSNP